LLVPWTCLKPMSLQRRSLFGQPPVSVFHLSAQIFAGLRHWGGVDDFTSHAISGLCLDDVIFLSL